MSISTTTRTTLVLFASLFLAGAPQDQAKPAVKEKFILDAGEHELLKVIEASARFLGRNYLLAPTEVGGQNPKVTLQKKLELDAAGCEAVVSQLAYAQGLIATPLDRGRGLWEFINMNGAKRAEAASRALALTPDEVRRMRDVRVYVITSAKVQHMRATVTSQTLRPFFAGAGGGLNIGTAGSERSILLQGLAEQVAQALDMIAEVDQPQPAALVEDDRCAALEARIKALEEAVKRLDGGKPK